MLTISSQKTSQRFRNFISKLPADYQLNIGGKRCIAARLYPSEGLENLGGPTNIIFDMNNPHDVEQLAFRIKYAKYVKTTIFSAEDIMEDYKKDGFYNSWILLWFQGVNVVGRGW